RSDGTQSPNFPVTTSGNIKTSPVLGHLDSDGDLDIIFPNDTGIIALDIKRISEDIIWKCFLGNYNRSGNVYQTTPVVEENTPEIVTALGLNYPNPFNPSTTITYSLKNPGKISLAIYNLKGQLVRNLIHQDMPAGNHQITWNGLDNNGSKASSGIYLYKFQADGVSQSKKMIMLK
ncbi:MAG: T9SS type A sorting domain-containing protein, partial [Candidatus Cloacimonetes bacterium]|nr:T9SS type A sorting domain-containing protein [Candidatus Cloacimonadota bacterium]